MSIATEAMLIEMQVSPDPNVTPTIIADDPERITRDNYGRLRGTFGSDVNPEDVLKFGGGGKAEALAFVYDPSEFLAGVGSAYNTAGFARDLSIPYDTLADIAILSALKGECNDPSGAIVHSNCAGFKTAAAYLINTAPYRPPSRSAEVKPKSEEVTAAPRSPWLRRLAASVLDDLRTPDPQWSILQLRKKGAES